MSSSNQLKTMSAFSFIKLNSRATTCKTLFFLKKKFIFGKFILKIKN